MKKKLALQRKRKREGERLHAYVSCPCTATCTCCEDDDDGCSKSSVGPRNWWNSSEEGTDVRSLADAAIAISGRQRLVDLETWGDEKSPRRVSNSAALRNRVHTPVQCGACLGWRRALEESWPSTVGRDRTHMYSDTWATRAQLSLKAQGGYMRAAQAPIHTISVFTGSIAVPILHRLGYWRAQSVARALPGILHSACSSARVHAPSSRMTARLRETMDRAGYIPYRWHMGGGVAFPAYGDLRNSRGRIRRSERMQTVTDAPWG